MFTIDYKSRMPISEQIYRSVVKLGTAGAFGEEGRLPSVRSVARELGINPNTVQKAYSLLERDGMICSLPGKGSFLVSNSILQEKRRKEALEALKKALFEGLECGLLVEDLEQAVQEALSDFRRTAESLPDKEETENKGGTAK